MKIHTKTNKRRKNVNYTVFEPGVWNAWIFMTPKECFN